MTPIKWLDQQVDTESSQDKQDISVSKISLTSDNIEQTSLDLSQLSQSHSNLNKTRISLNNYDVRCSESEYTVEEILSLSLKNCTLKNFDFRNVQNLHLLKLSKIHKMDVNQLSTLHSLRYLIIQSCQNFENLFFSIQDLSGLQELKIMWTDVGETVYINNLLPNLTHFSLQYCDTQLLQVEHSFACLQELCLSDVKRFVVKDVKTPFLQNLKLEKVTFTNFNVIKLTQLTDIFIHFQVTYSKIGIRNHNVRKRYEIITDNLLCVKKNKYITYGNELLDFDKFTLSNQETGYEKQFNSINSFENTLQNFILALNNCIYLGMQQMKTFQALKHKTKQFCQNINKAYNTLQ